MERRRQRRGTKPRGAEPRGSGGAGPDRLAAGLAIALAAGLASGAAVAPATAEPAGDEAAATAAPPARPGAPEADTGSASAASATTAPAPETARGAGAAADAGTATGGPAPTPGDADKAQAPRSPARGAPEAEAPAAPEPQDASPAPARRDFSALDAELEEIARLVEEAHFRTALAVAAATRTWLDRQGHDAAAEERRARLEVLRATAALALGRRGEARARMASALAADPDLSLDERRTSPKVVALLRELRARPAVGAPGPEPERP